MTMNVQILFITCLYKVNKTQIDLHFDMLKTWVSCMGHLRLYQTCVIQRWL